MIVYALGAYLNGIEVYFEGLNDSTPKFTDEINEAEFGTEQDIIKLKELFEEKGPQFGPYYIVEVTIEDEEDVE